MAVGRRWLYSFCDWTLWSGYLFAATFLQDKKWILIIRNIWAKDTKRISRKSRGYQRWSAITSAGSTPRSSLSTIIFRLLSQNRSWSFLCSAPLHRPLIQYLSKEVDLLKHVRELSRSSNRDRKWSRPLGNTLRCSSFLRARPPMELTSSSSNRELWFQRGPCSRCVSYLTLTISILAPPSISYRALASPSWRYANVRPLLRFSSFPSSSQMSTYSRSMRTKEARGGRSLRGPQETLCWRWVDSSLARWLWNRS